MISWLKQGARPSKSEIYGAGPVVDSIWNLLERLQLVDGLLYHCYSMSADGKSTVFQLCLPRILVSKVLKLMHSVHY